MELYSPFIIGPRLLPALRIGEALLSIESTAIANVRTTAAFVLDIGGQEYRINDVGSGVQGFRSVVEPFEALLSFMSACAESIQYRERTGYGGENAHLFEPAVAQWCADNATAIESVACELQNENGDVRHSLILA